MEGQTLEQRMHDGARAKEVLENEQFQLAFESTEKELITQWKSSNGSQDDREKTYQMLQALYQIKLVLENALATGRLAGLEVERRRTLADRIKEALR